MIRIRQIHEGEKPVLLVEGKLSGEGVQVLENCWLEAPHTPKGGRMRVDLSGVSWVDAKGRELIARMIQDGIDLRATGVMTSAIIEEIAEKIAMTRT
jgi:anti-anti-sigma regulatory factor